MDGDMEFGLLGLAAAASLRDAQLYVDLRGFTPNVPAMSTGEALDQLLRLLGVPAQISLGGPRARCLRRKYKSPAVPTARPNQAPRLMCPPPASVKVEAPTQSSQGAL